MSTIRPEGMRSRALGDYRYVDAATFTAG